jgi:hypothetical protein
MSAGREGVPFPKYPGETLESMAEIGEAFMDSMPEGYSWCQSPTEIITYLQNDSYDAEQRLATLTAELGAMREALAKCVRQFEDLDEHMPTDAGCIECTAGTVLNHLNTGLCGYHAAKALASKGPA